MALREYSGNARETTLNGAVNAAAMTLAVSDGTGYPTGATGSFVVTLEAGQAAEEKVLCASRTGNTLTVSSRGWDGTTASDHANGVSVQHTISATDLREANAFVNGGGLAVAAVGTQSIATLQTTASTGYVNLTTPGPATTVTIGASGRALVLLNAGLLNDTAGGDSFMTFDTTGIAAADTYALRFRSATAGSLAQVGAVFMATGITPGSRTFTARYRASGGTGSFFNRSITVIPL